MLNTLSVSEMLVQHRPRFPERAADDEDSASSADFDVFVTSAYILAIPFPYWTAIILSLLLPLLTSLNCRHFFGYA